MTLLITHFGPDPSTVGGMASVIRVLAEHDVGGDVVDFHPTWQPRSQLVTTRLFATSVRAIRKMPPGQVAHIHLSERGSFLREGSLLMLAHMHGLITVVTIHGASFVSFAHRHRRLVAAVLNSADVITCMDEAVLEIVRRSSPGIHCEIVPNPTSVDHGSPPADQTDELVVFAGEIGLRKGANVMHRAWQIVAERRPLARCLMVGPTGDFTPARVERLEVRPPVDAREMKEILRQARVVALPSRAEGMPMVLTEAMGAGRPFISTPVGGIPELATAGGILVPVGDDLSLADRLTDLLADPGLARSIGERGRRFCLRTRSIEVIDARLRTLYAAASKRSS
jgi:glycosyltransferase involved in cell wall biosynthesis